MIPAASTLLFALVLSVGTTAQTVPQCQQNCQASALSSTQCSATSAPCGCDSPYQQAMLECLVKPTAEGGCSYNEIISWMNTVQTQCFLSPPIIPPCRTICPLQAQEAADCTSDADNACICGTTYTASASSCLQQACPDQFQNWNDGHLDLCNSQTPSGPISSGGTVSSTASGATTTRSTSTSGTVNGTVTPTTTTTGTSSSTSSPSGAGVTRAGMGSRGLAVIAFTLSVAYSLL